MPRDFNSFDSDYYGNDVAPVTGPPWALSLWVYGIPSSFQQPASLVDKDVNNHMYVIRANASVAWGIRTRAGATDENLYTTTTPNTAGWNHVFALWASTTSRTVWCNGDAAGKGTSTASINPAGMDRFWIGGTGDSSPDFFGGRIAHVAIWSGSEITSFFTDAVVALMAKRLPVWSFLPQNIVSYYRMDGNDATLPLLDSGPLGNHLAVGNTPIVHTATDPRVMYSGRPIIVSPAVAAPPPPPAGDAVSFGKRRYIM